MCQYKCKLYMHTYTYITYIYLVYMSVQHKLMQNLLCELLAGWTSTGWLFPVLLPAWGRQLSEPCRVPVHRSGIPHREADVGWECDGWCGSHEGRARGKEVALKVIRNKGWVEVC